MPDWLSPYVPDEANLLVYVALAAVFGAVVLIVFGASALVAGRSMRTRLGEASPTTQVASAAHRGSLRFMDTATDFGRVLSPVTRRLLPTNLSEVSEIRVRLIRAGYTNPSAIGMFYATRFLLALALPALYLIVAPRVAHMVGSAGALGAGGALGLLGLYLPNAWIGSRARSLQTNYRIGFPDALDLLIVCVEAGLGLDAAIAKVGKELAASHSRLGDNFVQMTIELRAGTSRSEALRSLADRLGIDEVRSLVTLLIHSEELGTSIADALRAYSDDMRVRRLLTAELKANALSVKLSIPLVLFVFPVIMTVILLPIVIRIMRQLLVIKF
jgi:tight adherence protein C